MLIGVNTLEDAGSVSSLNGYGQPLLKERKCQSVACGVLDASCQCAQKANAGVTNTAQ